MVVNGRHFHLRPILEMNSLRLKSSDFWNILFVNLTDLTIDIAVRKVHAEKVWEETFSVSYADYQHWWAWERIPWWKYHLPPVEIKVNAEQVLNQTVITTDVWARSRFAVTEVETEWIEQFFSVLQKRKPNAPKSEHSKTCNLMKMVNGK